LALTGFAEAAAADPALADRPVIVYGSNGRPPAADDGLKALSRSADVRQAVSPERLLDQASAVLHYPLAALPAAQRLTLENLHQADKALAGKKVLIVDDDIRNIFALTSVLEW